MNGLTTVDKSSGMHPRAQRPTLNGVLAKVRAGTTAQLDRQVAGALDLGLQAKQA